MVEVQDEILQNSSTSRLTADKAYEDPLQSSHDAGDNRQCSDDCEVKAEHSSSRNDRGSRAESRDKSPTDEESDEQEKENSDNQELNGYRRDEYKEGADELRKRSKNMRIWVRSDEQLLEVAPQSSSDAGKKRGRTPTL